QNFVEILETVKGRFEKIMIDFAPVHVNALKSFTQKGDPNNERRFQEWKQEMITIANRYPNVIVIDYQTRNRITTDYRNYWDYTHCRSSIHRMIMEDFLSVMKKGSLKYAGFGKLAVSK